MTAQTRLAAFLDDSDLIARMWFFHDVLAVLLQLQTTYARRRA